MKIKARPEAIQFLEVRKFWIDVWIDKVKYSYIQYTYFDENAEDEDTKVLISYEIRKKGILVKDENIIKVIVDYLRKENYITSQG